MSAECKWCGMELSDSEIGMHHEICDTCRADEMMLNPEEEK